MKFKNLLTLFILLMPTMCFTQQVEITHLHEFEGPNVNKMLISSTGELVTVGSESEAFFSIRDTVSFQVIADTSPSYNIHGDPIDDFFDVTVHKDSGYLVCGRIPLRGSSIGTPIIYWFNKSAEIIHLYEGETFGTDQTGYYPVFRNIIMRSDSHIIALYQYTWISNKDDSTQAAVLFEFDKSLNLIRTDTIRKFHGLNMRYNLSEEKLVLWGVQISGKNPNRYFPYCTVLDAFTFQTENEIIHLNQSGWVSTAILKNKNLIYSFQTGGLICTSKIINFDLNKNLAVDSLIFKGDSSCVQITSITNRINNGFVVFNTRDDLREEWEYRSQNHLSIYTSDFDLLFDTLIYDTIASRVNLVCKTPDSYFFGYEKYIPSNPSGHQGVLVLKKATIMGITSVSNIIPTSEHWNMFPNPTNGSLHFNIPLLYQNETLQYHLFNATGILLETNSMTSNRIDISTLPHGLYILTITNNNHKLFTTKISKL